jgi:hypothetical protein
MTESYWKKKAVEPAQATGARMRARDAIKRAVDTVVFAVINHNEPPARPHVFKIVDEHGVEREVYAPPGHVTRWPWP